MSKQEGISPLNNKEKIRRKNTDPDCRFTNRGEKKKISFEEA